MLKNNNFCRKKKFNCLKLNCYSLFILMLIIEFFFTIIVSCFIIIIIIVINVIVMIMFIDNFIKLQFYIKLLQANVFFFNFSVSWIHGWYETYNVLFWRYSPKTKYINKWTSDKSGMNKSHLIIFCYRFIDRYYITMFNNLSMIFTGH